MSLDLVYVFCASMCCTSPSGWDTKVRSRHTSMARVFVVPSHSTASGATQSLTENSIKIYKKYKKNKSGSKVEIFCPCYCATLYLSLYHGPKEGIS